MGNKIINDAPNLTGENTQAQVFEQGITYDQVGFTYDQIGIAYGGIYNTDEDVIPTISLAENIIPRIAMISDEGRGFTDPIISLAETIRPSIFGYSDIYTNNTPPPPQPNAGMLMGILGLTYPS